MDICIPEDTIKTKFDDTSLDFSVVNSFLLQNKLGADANFSFIKIPEEFDIYPLQGTITSKQTQKIRLIWTPIKCRQSHAIVNDIIKLQVADGPTKEIPLQSTLPYCSGSTK